MAKLKLLVCCGNGAGTSMMIKLGLTSNLVTC